jgi:hypothetical protein
MTRTLLCLASAAALAAATAPALAQTPPAQTPPAQTATTPTTPEAPKMGAPGEGLSANMPVNDNAGVKIGSITELKPDASGKTMATITMPEGAFAVDSKALVVMNGAAVINMTQAQLQAQVKAAAPATPPAAPEQKPADEPQKPDTPQDPK